MPKLPKKSTMKEVISRASGYSYKLTMAGKRSMEDHVALFKLLKKLMNQIDK